MLKGTIVAQIIGVICAVFIAKLYGSEAFGFLSVFIGISAILSVFNTLQLENCIVLAKEKLAAKHWFNFLFFIIPILTLVGFLFLYPVFLLLFKKNINYPTFITAIVASIFLSYNKTHESILTKYKNFTTIAFGKVLLVIINVSFQFIFYYKYKYYGLIYSALISIIIVSIYFVIKNKKSYHRVSLQFIKKELKKHNSIVKYLFPSRLINSLAIQSIPILIFALFSPRDAGIYFFSQKILSIPLLLISSSISQVYFEKSTDLFNNSKTKLFGFTKKIMRNNILIILSFIILINTLGIYLLEMLLKNSWENLRLYTLILSFLIFAKSFFSPISNIIVVLNKNHIALIFNIYILFVNLIAIYFGYAKNNLLYSIYILSFLGGIGYVSLAFYFLKKLKDIK